MPVTNLPIIKGDKTADNADYRDALPVNYTLVAKQILGASGYLISHDGLTLHGTGLGIDRAGYWNERQKIHFRVSGTDLVSVSASGVVASLGAISGNDRASMTHSFNTQMIVADGKAWLYDGTLTQITDTDLGTPIDVTWIDGYYFFTDGEYLYHTDITSEKSIDPRKFATSEFSPDPTLAVDRTSGNQVIVFDRYSTTWFENKSTENFAFRRISNKFVKCGIVGTHCETELEGRFYIIGGGREEDVSIHQIGAGTYESIATREVTKILGTYTEAQLSMSVLETRVKEGTRILIAQLPNRTLEFNSTIARSLGIDYAWTIVESGVSNATKWRGVNGVYDPRISKFVYGDNQNSNIGILDEAVATQYGEQVESIFYSPLVLMETMSIDEIELNTIPGHQFNVDDVTCGVSLTYNGLTYGTEYFVLYGQQTVYGTRFIERAFGYVPELVGVKVRTASKERVAFTMIKLTYS
jgi:hypothetical protein